MNRKGSWVIVMVTLAMLVTAGCGIVTGRRSFSNGYGGQGAPETASAGTQIGTSSGEVASAQVDPCTLDLENPIWRDHGGRLAYEKRCGHPPPP